MVEVSNIRVSSTDRDSITVTWTIAETSEDLSTYQVVVLRSEGEHGPYQAVSPTLSAQDHFDFEDRGPNQISKWRRFYYRVRVTSAATAEAQEFGSVPHRAVLKHNLDPGGVSMEAPPDLEALEAVRRFGLVAQEYAGRKVLFLPVRTSGQRCPDCWDPLTRRVTRSNCQACFRTGFTGGYYSPRRGHIVSVPSAQMVALTPLLTLEPSDVVRWVPASTRLRPYDVMIDTENRRWRVITVKRQEKAQALTRQTVQLREVNRDQIEYRIPVQFDEDIFTAAPHRQFIRATDIDSYHKAAAALSVDETPNQIRDFKTNVGEA